MQNLLTWLRRTWKDYISRQDIIDADIGDDARGVAVGKNIIQIGKLEIPLWLALFIAIAVALILIRVIWQTVVPLLTQDIMPNDSFNIAVAEWNIRDKEDRLVTDRKVHDHSLQILAKVANYLGHHEATDNSISEVVTVYGPDKHNIPSVTTENDAMQLTHKLNARVLIYGDVKIYSNVKTSTLFWQITPKFYFNSESFPYARELVGSYALGATISYTTEKNSVGDIVSDKEGELNDTLSERLDALLPIFRGLAYIVQEPPKYDKAELILKNFSQKEGWPKGKGEGQEILYHFLGSTYLGQALATSEPAKKNELLLQSRDAFSQAITLNKDYARPYNSLGSVYYDLSLEKASCSKEALALLKASNDTYSGSLSIASEHKPVYAYVDDFAYAGKAAVEVLRANCALNAGDYVIAQTHYQTATKYYQAVIQADNKQSELNTVQVHLAVYAHTGLAQIAFNKAYNFPEPRQENLIKASKEYEQAFQLIDQSGTKENIDDGIDLMPEYLSTLCQLHQRTKADTSLKQLLDDVKTIKFFKDVEAVQKEKVEAVQKEIEQALLDRYKITWRDCT